MKHPFRLTKPLFSPLNNGDRNQKSECESSRAALPAQVPQTSVLSQRSAKSEIMDTVCLHLSKWLDLGTDFTLACALDELEGRAAQERICVCFGRPVLFAFVRHAISGEARTDAISCAAVFRSVFPFASHV